MFSKDKKSKSGLDNHNFEKNNVKTTPSIISEDLVISGDLIGDGEVQVDGKVEGDVRCRTLIVGITGMVVGAVNVDEARIYGCIKGQLIAKSVFFASTARMDGDVAHDSIAVEPGAFIEGRCHRITDPIPAEQGAVDLMITDGRLQARTKKLFEADPVENTEEIE
ncbi:MAG: polymer-forming cytoskeletal protein [Alphaproteobacteria bacterium]